MSDIREASLTHEAAHLPGGALLQAGPFVILAVAALWVRSRYDELPARLPAHWNASGEIDRWVARTPANAYGPVLIGAAMCALMLFLQLGIQYGAPRGGMQRTALRILLAVEYFMAFLFCGILGAMLTGGAMLTPVLALSVAATLLLLAVTVAVARRAEPVRPNAGGQWRGGFFYVDPEDPALFVPKRWGIGYTLNYGNPRAVPVTLLILAVPLAIAYFALNAR